MVNSFMSKYNSLNGKTTHNYSLIDKVHNPCIVSRTLQQADFCSTYSSLFGNIECEN